MAKLPHLAFGVDYNRIVPEIATTIIEENPISKQSVTVKGVWDTGATHSVISPKVFDILKLNQIDTAIVSGVSSINHKAIVTVANLILPNNVRIPDVRLTVDEIVNTEVLIGMDIINFGDFSISNANKQTYFSFACPPFENPTDLVEKADRMNERNKKHFPPMFKPSK